MGYILGRYRVQACLSSSAERRVYRAVDTFLDRTVVIKGVVAGPGDSSSVIVDEFARLRACTHPQIAAAYDLGQADGVPDEATPGRFVFFTQEWLSGPSLTSLAGRLSVDEVATCMVQLLEVVAYLHQLGLTRLDLKPDHLVRQGPGWCLIDLDQARPDAPLGEAELHGTLNYLAPEVLTRGAGGPQADLYSVGAILFEALLGFAPPVEGATLEEAGAWLSHSKVPEFPLQVERQAPRLVELARWLLARSPGSRPPSAEHTLAWLAGTRLDLWRRTSPLPHGPLRGRDTELKKVQAFAQDAQQVGGGCVLVVGPPQSGRSRFLTELTSLWQSEGLPALGVSPEHLPPGPLGLIRVMVAHLNGLANPGQAGMEGTTAWEGGGQVEHQEWVQRMAYRVWHSGSQIQAHYGNRLIPILIDDVHHLDEASQAVLLQLLPYLDGSGLFLVMAQSEGSGDGGLPPGIPQVHLDPLAEADAREMVEDALGAGSIASAEELSALLAETSSLPGKLRDHLLPRWRGVSDLPTDSVSASTPGGEFSGAGPWSEEDVTILRAAVYLGDPVSLVVLNQVVSPLEAEPLLTRLAELRLVRLSAGSSGLPESMCWQERSLPNHIQDETPPEVARSLHLRCAEVLEHHAFVDDSITPAQIAHHFLQAGARVRALPYLQRGLQRALERGSLLAARALAEQLLESLPPGDSAALHLQARIGDIERDLGRPVQARDRYLAALARPRVLGPVGHRVMARLGIVQITLGDNQAAQDNLQTAIREALNSTPREELVQWLHQLAYLQLQLKNPEAAQLLLESAQDAGIPPDSRMWVDQTHLEAFLGSKQKLAPQVALPRLTQAIQVAQRLEYHRGEFKLLNTAISLYQGLGDTHSQLPAMQKAVELARRTFDRNAEAVAVRNLGVLLRESQRDMQGALEQFERAALIWRRLGNPARELYNLLDAADLLLKGGKLDRASHLLARATTSLATIPGADPVLGLICDLFNLRLRLLGGNTNGLDVALTGLVGKFQTAGHPGLELEVLADRMELALMSGRPEEASQLFQSKPQSLQAEEKSLAERLDTLAEQARKALRSPPPSAAPASAVDVQADTLAWLHRVRGLLQVSDEPELLAERLSLLVGELLEGRGLVLLYDGNMPQVVHARGLSPLEVEDVSRTFIEKVLSSGQPCIEPDIRLVTALKQVKSLRASKVVSVACYPILQDNVCIGALYVDHRQAGRVSSDSAIKAMEQVAQLAREVLLTLRRRRNNHPATPSDFDLVGESAASRAFRENMRRFAEQGSPDLVLLLLGETGTGKTTAAHQFHEQGPRHGKPFVPVNCGGITPSLFESQMYGHEKGAFSGAVSRHRGFFEQATGGILFLDEVGDIPLEQQVKLLTVLSHGEFTRVGGSEKLKVDVQLILATNRDLPEEVRAGRMREDFLRRIWITRLVLPPLRERGREDVLTLASLMIQKYLRSRQVLAPDSKPIKLSTYLTAKAIDLLGSYHWPWNVGELENIFRNEMVKLRLCSGEKVDEKLITEALGLTERRLGGPSLPGLKLPPIPTDTTLEDLRKGWFEEVQRIFAQDLLTRCKGNKSEVARRLDCSRDRVHDLLRPPSERK